MFDWATQNKYDGKALSAPCKLLIAKWSETLRKSRSYVNDEVKKLVPLRLLARLNFVSASSFEHQTGAITLPSAAAARPLCLNPVLLDTRSGGGASALPIPTAAPPAPTTAEKMLTAVPMALLLRCRGHTRGR